MPLRYPVHDFFHLPQAETLRRYGEEEKAVAGNEERRRAKRCELAKQDLYYLLTRVLGYTHMHHPWIFARCREVQSDPDDYLDLWAREHYKSTIITLGMTILDIINDPEITFGIFSHKKPIAEAFLAQIKETCETSVDLRYLFPDIFWANTSNAPVWSVAKGITVIRKNKRKEPTVSAWGLVDGMPTGMHFDVRVLDDMVTEKSVTNPEIINKTTERWSLSQNLGTEGGVERIIGTCYHLHDTYSTVKERGTLVRTHPCTADGSDDLRKTVLKSVAYLAKMKEKQGTYTFACQMLLNPKGDNVQGFEDEWLKYWGATHDKNLNKIIVVDPSSGRKGKDGKQRGDYTSMWVLGLGGDGNWYVLDMIRDRLNLTGRTNALFSLHRTWFPIMKVGYEEVGLQADIEHMESKQADENYRFKIIPLPAKAISKTDRIKRLSPLFEAHKIYLPVDCIKQDHEKKAINLVRVFREQEYSKFPVLLHDDMLDALSRICDEEMAIPLPKLKEPGYNALLEARRLQRKNRPVV